MPHTSFRHKIGLIMLGVILSLVLLEGGLRLAGFIYIYSQEKSNLKITNEKDAYRIMCVGESTTALGDDYSYPRQLERVLNVRSPQRKFVVFNNGVPGTNSSEIVENLQRNLNRYKPDMVIVMMGINDVERQVYEEAMLTHARYLINSLRIVNVVRWFMSAAEEFREMHKVKRKLRDHNAKPLELIGMAEHFKGLRRFNLVERLLKRAIELEPENGSLYMELWRFYWQQEQFEEADLLVKAASSKKLNYDRRLEIAEYYREVDRATEAIEHCQIAIQMNPSGEKAYVQWAANLFDADKYQEGRVILQKIWDLDRKLDDGQMEMVVFHYLDGNHDKAESILKNPIDRNTKVVEDLAELGSRYWERGKLADAAKIFAQVRSLQPDQHMTNTRLLQFMKYQENPETVNNVFNDLWYSPNANHDFLRNYAELYKIDEKKLPKHINLRGQSMDRLWHYNDRTKQNYIRLSKRLSGRGIKLVVMQYPMRDIDSLKRIFPNLEDIMLISNESVFKQAVRENGYAVYFEDLFAGDFGHCTAEGNRVLAENIADHILTEQASQGL